MPMRLRASRAVFAALCFLSFTGPAHAAAKAAEAAKPENVTTLWELVSGGGLSMILLAGLSIATLAFVVYHFLYVRSEKLVPQDLSENLISLLERREFEKAKAVCRQQPNLVSAIALKGLEKQSKGPAVVEEAIQYEGRARVESLWQNLTYLGDLAVIAPMVGLLGTIVGMIEAFGYFKAGSINPTVLTQGLAKAMINTAAGLVIAVPALLFYSYFRGRISVITSTTEAIAAEMVQVMTKDRA